MGLAAPKNRMKLSHDPNNTKWTSDTQSFGHKMMAAQGWKPGEYLGAKNAPHAEFHTAANASHIRVMIKDDNLGLGAKVGSGVGHGECTGLDAFKNLLGRLNGKDEDELEKEQKSREDLKRAIYSEQRWGSIRFVQGGFLVGDKIQNLIDEETERVRKLAAGSESVSSTSLESDSESEPEPVVENAKKSKKRKLEDREASETIVLKPRRSKKHKPEAQEDVPEVFAVKTKKSKKKRKPEALPEDMEEVIISSQDVKSSKKKSKQRREEEALSQEESTETKKRKKEKRDKKDRKNKEGSRSRVDAEPVAKESKKKSKRDKKKRDSESLSEATESVKPTTKEHTPSTPLEIDSGRSTPIMMQGRHAVRARNIAQKRLASMDVASLNQHRPCQSETLPDFLAYEIRLLNILDAPYDESVHCSLETTTLVDPGSYHALSYCWGDVQNMQNITVNDTVVEVRPNLEAALRQLRSRGYLRVWIDALCINQDDIEERGLQIRNMRQIYSQAIHVISWLGDDPDNIANAVKYLFENERYKWFPGRRRTAVVGFTSHARGAKTEEQGEWDSQRWMIFQSFFGLDYWRRVWVIQEIASSSRVEVLMGRMSMDWQYITAAVEYWKEHSDQVPKACASYEHAAELDHFRMRFNDRRPISLFEAIHWSHYALATDQLDRIYALLGLTFDGPRLVPIPNYKRTIEQLLCDLTRELLTVAKSAESTSMIFPYHSERGSPWLGAKSLQLWSEINMNLGSPCCSLNPMFSPVPMKRSPNAKSLQAEGILLGQISQISSPLLRPKDVANKSKSFVDDAESQNFDVTSSNLDLYPSGILAAILQTLCFGQVPSSIDPQTCLNNLWRPKGRREVPRWINLDWDNLWNDINRWLQMNSSLRIGSSTLQQWVQSDSKINRLKNLLHASNESFPNEAFGRCIEMITKTLKSQMRLIVTQTGLIGMAPPTAHVGDWVWYVKGLDIPVILRAKELTMKGDIREHVVIGGAYAHMDQRLPGSGGFGAWAQNFFMKAEGFQSIVIA
ncbi:hypothetical protein D0Z07_2864 [Hyphodiscus hymeniophilus]|uniref:G-patch domain-containing protein n=1 Tax=Hyphodiscus hymeniophilus TaxID=353542 RepID=A0A9P6VM58_9HELO|nr:hypothetical protein D0Z07_2864 [Hyphodiscus hymeniophilus]